MNNSGVIILLSFLQVSEHASIGTFSKVCKKPKTLQTSDYKQATAYSFLNIKGFDRIAYRGTRKNFKI